MSNVKEEIAQTKRDIELLRERIGELMGDLDAAVQPVGQAALDANAAAEHVLPNGLKPRQTLKGHFGKVYSLQWNANDGNQLVSASQDGKLIVWNARTALKNHAILLRSSWVMTCAFSDSGNLVACGGLDNMCTVYRLDGDTTAPVAELAQHEGYVSSCRFMSDDRILSASGDSSTILWDVNTRTPQAVFREHTGDIMSVAVHGKNVFVSGSCDATSRMFDVRQKDAQVGVFVGHESDINSVAFFPDGNAFVSGSDDSSCRMQDVRAKRQVQRFSSDKLLVGVTSVDFSGSGRMLVAGYDDYNAYLWDTLTGETYASLVGHENRVSCVGVSPDGKAIATGSWDTALKVWA